MAKYRIKPSGCGCFRIERREWDQTGLIPWLSWVLVAYTEKADAFEEIIKEDALKEAAEAQHTSTPVRYARTTLYRKSIRDALDAHVTHL